MDKYFLVNLYHLDEGKLIRRELSSVPAKGDWIKFSNNTYIVKKVIWNFDDARTVNIYVDELED